MLVIYLESVLRFSVSSIGVIEGMAEATNSVMKDFSSALSDHMGRRKPLTVTGMGPRLWLFFANNNNPIVVRVYKESMNIFKATAFRNAFHNVFHWEWICG